MLSTHNKNILNLKQTSFGCNCRNKDNCPLDGECLTPNIIYRADITTDNDHKFYYGTSETTFKKRHSNHTRDFKHVKYQHATELAKHIWQLKNNNFNYSIKWLIASKVCGHDNSLSCKLCLTLFRMGFLMYIKRMGWGKITPPGLFLVGLSYQAYFWYITSLSYVV